MLTKTIKRSYILLLIIVFTRCANPQNTYYTDKYNLDFEVKDSNNISPWITPTVYPVLFKQDSTQVINNLKYPLCLSQRSMFKRQFNLNGKLYQRILLPNTNCDSLTIKLRSKSENLNTAQLVVSSIDNSENIKYVDSISLTKNDDWSTFSITAPVKSIKIINITIKAEGIKDSIGQKLCLDNIKIMLDGKNINNFPLQEPLIPKIKMEDIIPLSFSDDSTFNKINDFSNKKILAIGETVHGSKTINEATSQLIKYQVKYNDTKLILLEFPIQRTLSMNRFIQGDSRFDLSEILSECRSVKVSPYVIKDLLLWLRDYNRQSIRKVWLIGVDIGYMPVFAGFSIRDYLFTINEDKNNKKLTTLISKLSDTKNFPDALLFLTSNKEIEELLGVQEYKLLKHLLSISTKYYSQRSHPPFLLRDRYMFYNSEFLIDLLCQNNEKTVIYAHFLHTNPINFFDLSYYSYGNYMRRKYKDDYYSLALLVEKGTFIVNDRGRDRDSLFVKRNLAKPPSNSIESVLSKSEFTYGFLSVSNISNRLTQIRTLGSEFSENQFSIISPRSRMDGLLFIKRSEAYSTMEGTPLTSKDLNMYNFNLIKKYVEKFRDNKRLNKK